MNTPARPTSTANSRKLTLLPLIAATYFMVAGGPYGIEELIGRTGYAVALGILVLTPLLWSLPTALMVTELSTALPKEGGFYIWVRRGMGTFWGYMETWLTLAGSVFEMALYPTLFVDYLGHLAPRLISGDRGLLLELGMIAACAIWNIAGARAVGEGAIWLNGLLFAPFLVLIVLAVARPAAMSAVSPREHLDLLGGLLVAMWNYMGWDNISTVAGEVDRPKRTYPLAMLIAVILVTASYVLPVAAVAAQRLNLNIWMVGGWVDAGRAIGGTGLAAGVAGAGAIGAFGSFAALMLSFTRLPAVMAEDGFLPRLFIRHNARGAPWVAIIACALLWAACLPLGFLRILILDVLLTGASVLLEFAALIALRIREPDLPRPYRVPGGLLGAIAVAIPPTALMILGVVRNRSEEVGTSLGTTNELAIGAAILVLGIVLYFLSPGSRRANPDAAEIRTGLRHTE